MFSVVKVGSRLCVSAATQPAISSFDRLVSTGRSAIVG